MDRFTVRLREEFGLPLVDSPQELTRHADMVLVTAADPRTHPEIAERVVPAGKPVFVDKALCADSASARHIVALAERYKTPILAGSPHRFDAPLTRALTATPPASISGVDIDGPMPNAAPLPRIFWYGVHLVEMLYTSLGIGCRRVTAVGSAETADIAIIGEWDDGRLGVLRGSPQRPHLWTARLHHNGHISVIDSAGGARPRHAGLMGAVVTMGRTGAAPVSSDEIVEVVRFMEAAEQSRLLGSGVSI